MLGCGPEALGHGWPRPTGQERLFRSSRPQPVPRSDRPSGPSGCFQAIRGGARSREVDSGLNTQPRERVLADRNSTFLRDVLRIFQPFMSYPGIVRMRTAEYWETTARRAPNHERQAIGRSCLPRRCEDGIAGASCPSIGGDSEETPPGLAGPLGKCDRFAGRIRNDVSVKGDFRPLLEME